MQLLRTLVHTYKGVNINFQWNLAVLVASVFYGDRYIQIIIQMAYRYHNTHHKVVVICLSLRLKYCLHHTWHYTFHVSEYCTQEHHSDSRRPG